MEVSAKDDINIREAFRTFLTLSKILQRDTEDIGLKRRASVYLSTSKGNHRTESSSSDTERSATSTDASGSISDNRPKPRSRSLIRRSSRKTKQQIRDASNLTEECIIS